MERERPFRMMVIPETPGSVEDILSRAPIGEKNKEIYIDRMERQRTQLKEVIRKVSDRSEKWEEFLFENNFPKRDDEYVLNLSGSISSTEKKKLFAPSILAMQRLAQEHGIVLPGNLLERLLIVDRETYMNVYFRTQFFLTKILPEIHMILRKHLKLQALFYSVV